MIMLMMITMMDVDALIELLATRASPQRATTTKACPEIRIDVAQRHKDTSEREA